MCNKGFQCLSESENTVIDHRQQHFMMMDSPTAIRSPATTGSGPGSNDDGRRVKFLCSFLGSIMPRPQDGKLRYVGGETRIVSVSRDISFEELMGKMRELYEGVAVLKYQQPDEDLDALVSVVNDDDVVNMMEEYDKLGSGDGFTRLRIFLFSQSEQDGSAHFIDGDDPERRYVDALNSLNDASELRRLQQMEFPLIGTVEDIHVGDQYISPVGMENGILSQRSGELAMSQYGLHHMPIQHQQSMGQRYNEIDAPWNSGYYSPRHHGQCHHDSRTSLVEYPSSPSGPRYRMPFPEMPDKGIDRVSDEYARHHINHHPVYDNQPPYPENVVWLPTGPAHGGDKSGFPGNVLHGSHALDGNNICEHCRMSFQRPQPHLEHPNMLPPVAIPCPECPSSRDALIVNADAKLQPPMYPNDTQNHERGCGLQHQNSGRVGDHYVGDVPIISFSPGHGSMIDGHALPSNHVHQPVGPELGVELFPDQTMANIPHLKIPPLEESSVQYGNPPPPYGVDNNYAMPRGQAPGYTLWRNGPTPVHIGPPHEATTLPQPVDGVINAGIIRGEGSPGFFVGPDSQSLWVDSSQKFSGHDGSATPEYPHTNAPKLNPMAIGQENPHPIIVDAIHPPQDVNASIYMEPVQLQKSSFHMVHNNGVLNFPPVNDDDPSDNVVPHSAGSQVLDDPSDDVFLDEIRKFHDDFQLGFGEDFLPVNDDNSCKDIPMDKNSVPEKNAVNDDDFLLLCREIDRFSSYQAGEGSGYVNGDNRSSVEVGEVSDLRHGPVLDLLPDSIRSRFEKVVAGVSYEAIESFTTFEVLKAIKKKLTLLETAKRSGFAFPEI